MARPDYRKEIIFSIILFASFFIPYIKLGPLSLSGYQIADGAKSIFDLDNLFNAKISDEAKFYIYEAYSLYLIPILSGLTIIFALLDINPKYTSAMSGIYVLLTFIYCLFTFDKFWNLTGIGTYIAIISGSLLLIFSLMPSIQKGNLYVSQDEKNVTTESNITIQKQQTDMPSKMSIQEWRIQNPHKSLNDYFKEFGH